VLTGEINDASEMCLNSKGFIATKDEITGNPSHMYSCGDLISKEMFRFFKIRDKGYCSISKLVRDLNVSFAKIVFNYKFVGYCSSMFTDKLCKTSGDGATLKIRSTATRYHDKLQEIETLMENNVSIRHGLDKVSKIVTDLNDDTCKNAMLLRKSFGLPFIQESNVYGVDLSLLDLSCKIFKNKNMKDYCFTGCDLRYTVFNNCTFSCSNFVGADLKGTIFKKCKFRHMSEISGGPFYKAKVNKDTKIMFCGTCSMDLGDLHRLVYENGLPQSSITCGGT